MTSLFSRFIRQFTTPTTAAIAPMEGSGSAAAAGPTEIATVAAGCFWGVEHIYRKHFAGKGLIDAKVGYIGGDSSSPTYREVCGGSTGHAEALQITFNPDQLPYRTIIEFLLKTHDPTQLNRQGPDVGTQYRSGIFYHSDEQKSTAEEVIKMANKYWYNGRIATEIVKAGEWWDAEAYHQRYLDVNPGGYECPTHFLRKDLVVPEGGYSNL